MPPTLENTMRKYNEVSKALKRVNSQRGARQVQEYNVPSHNQILNNLNKALSLNQANTTLGGSNRAALTAYFLQYPLKRQYVIYAHRKLNNLHRELNGVARKIMATRTLQRRWRTARPSIIGPRKIQSLVALNSLQPNMTRKILSSAFYIPTAHGPLTVRRNASKEYNTY